MFSSVSDNFCLLTVLSVSHVLPFGFLFQSGISFLMAFAEPFETQLISVFSTLFAVILQSTKAFSKAWKLPSLGPLFLTVGLIRFELSVGLAIAEF